MAKGMIMGMEGTEAMLGRMGRPMLRRILDAGANAAAERMRSNIRDRGHIRTGDMLRSVGAADYTETLGGGAEYVYPQGENREGQRTATIAYVINYGRGGRKGPRSGDRFITGDERAAGEVVQKAMQEEAAKIAEELNG